MQLPFTKTEPEQLSPYTDWHTGCTTVPRFWASAKYFALFKNVQTASEFHQTCYLVGTEVSFHEDKAADV